VEDPKLRRNIVIAKKTESASGGEKPIYNKFSEKRRSEHT
jgi:hypothetical protein